MFKVPKAVRMMNHTHTKSSSNMLHEESVKCSSKVNDFTSQRVRGNKIQLRGGGRDSVKGGPMPPPPPPLNEALLAACICVSLYVCVC